MCTVTFVPVTEGYFISSNRDEFIHRGRTLEPATYVHQNRDLIYPRDEKGRGTWIAASKEGSVAVLLNGARENHRRKPAYRHSRGLIIPAILPEPDPFEELEKFPLSDIEPFTLILFHDYHLFAYRWNEKILEREELDTREAHCWNSMTLYKPAMEENNKLALRRLYHSGLDRERILAFHEEMRYERQLPQDSAVNQIQTISISQIGWQQGKIQFHYAD